MKLANIHCVDLAKDMQEFESSSKNWKGRLHKFTQIWV